MRRLSLFRNRILLFFIVMLLIVPAVLADNPFAVAGRKIGSLFRSVSGYNYSSKTTILFLVLVFIILAAFLLFVFLSSPMQSHPGIAWTLALALALVLTLVVSQLKPSTEGLAALIPFLGGFIGAVILTWLARAAGLNNWLITIAVFLIAFLMCVAALGIFVSGWGNIASVSSLFSGDAKRIDTSNKLTAITDEWDKEYAQLVADKDEREVFESLSKLFSADKEMIELRYAWAIKDKMSERKTESDKIKAKRDEINALLHRAGLAELKDYNAENVPILALDKRKELLLSAISADKKLKEADKTEKKSLIAVQHTLALAILKEEVTARSDIRILIDKIYLDEKSMAKDYNMLKKLKTKLDKKGEEYKQETNEANKKKLKTLINKGRDLLAKGLTKTEAIKDKLTGWRKELKNAYDKYGKDAK